MLVTITAAGKGMSHTWYADLDVREVRDIEGRLRKAVADGLLEEFSAAPASLGLVQARVFPHRTLLLEIADFISIVNMPSEVKVSFEPLRTQAWKGLLIKAFSVLPKRLDEILSPEGWKDFTDFMAAVGRSGRIILQFGRPSMKTIQERGVEAEIQKMRAESNTEAMLRLLSGAFFGIQEGEPDPRLALEALSRVGIRNWNEFAHAVLGVALAVYAERTGGRTPLDTAKMPTLLFYDMHADAPPDQVIEVTQAFGLASTRHFTALLATFYAAEVTVQDLDQSVGDYALLTDLVNRAPSNPEPGIVFRPPGEFQK